MVFGIEIELGNKNYLLISLSLQVTIFFEGGVWGADRRSIAEIMWWETESYGWLLLFYFRLHAFLPYYYNIKGKCKDGFSYVLYINGGHPPWSLLYPLIWSYISLTAKFFLLIFNGNHWLDHKLSIIFPNLLNIFTKLLMPYFKTWSMF